MPQPCQSLRSTAARSTAVAAGGNIGREPREQREQRGAVLVVEVSRRNHLEQDRKQRLDARCNIPDSDAGRRPRSASASVSAGCRQLGARCQPPRCLTSLNLHAQLHPLLTGIFENIADQNQIGVLCSCYVHSQSLRMEADGLFRLCPSSPTRRPPACSPQPTLLFSRLTLVKSPVRLPRTIVSNRRTDTKSSRFNRSYITSWALISTALVLSLKPFAPNQRLTSLPHPR